MKNNSMIKLLSSLNKKTMQASHRIPWYGCIASIGFLSFYFLNICLSKNHVLEDFHLRLIATFLSIPLIFFNKWPSFLNKFKAIYWNVSLLYTQPFFFTYMLIKNSFDITWCLNGIISLILIVLVTDWLSAFILTMLGIIAAYKYAIVQGYMLILPESFGGILASYIGMIIYVKIFVVKEEQLNQEKLRSMKALAGAIAHEMRTPLLTLSAIAHRLDRILPTMMPAPLSQKKDVEWLEGAPQNINNITRGANNIINILLMNLKEETTQDTFEVCHIKACISNALNEYHFHEEDRKRIHWADEIDFVFKGNPTLIKHVLFNLMKNALYYIKVAHKGDIYISQTQGNEMNTLHFKDTGNGISPEALCHIFDKFYSKTNHGTGIGLAFCKQVMEDLGGSITCASIENEYTEFILSFPTMKDKP